MKMRLMVAVAIAFAAMVAPAAAERISSRPACVAPAAQLINGGKQVSAVGGKCTLRKKVVSARYFYEYVQVDQAGTSCSSSPLRGTGRHYKLLKRPSILRFRFGVAAVSTPRRTVWARWRNFSVRGSDFQCGKLTPTTQLPSPAQLCAVTEGGAQDPTMTGSCGTPIPNSSAWAGPATLQNNEVVAGPIVSPASPCTYQRDSRPITWFTPVPISISPVLDCANRNGAVVGLVSIRLGHYQGGQLVTDCEARPDGIAVTRFTIPPEWSGVLVVEFWIIPLILDSTGRRYASKQYESQTSLFNLSGTQSGCPLKLAPITGS